MKKEKFSHTRVSSFQTCKWQYYLKYVKKFKVERSDNTKLASKGVAFHEVAEKYDPKQTIEDLAEAMRKRAGELGVDPDEYDYYEAARRLRWFMDDFVAEKGLVIEREAWLNCEISGEPVCGALDVKLEAKDKKGAAYIVDFKSGKKPDTEAYRGQLALYAYMLGKARGYSWDETVENVKTYAFFPLADLGAKAKKLSDSERAMDSLREIRFTEDQLVAAMAKFEETMGQIRTTDWSKISENDADLSFVCSFCQFAGIPKSVNPHCHCERTYKNGVRAPRSIKIGLDQRRA